MGGPKLKGRLNALLKVFITKTNDEKWGLEFYASTKLRKPLKFDPDNLNDLKFGQVTAFQFFDNSRL